MWHLLNSNMKVQIRSNDLRTLLQKQGFVSLKKRERERLWIQERVAYETELLADMLLFSIL